MTSLRIHYDKVEITVFCFAISVLMRQIVTEDATHIILVFDIQLCGNYNYDKTLPWRSYTSYNSLLITLVILQMRLHLLASVKIAVMTR